VEEDGSMDENMDGEDMNSEIDEDENEMEKAALLLRAHTKTPKLNNEAELMEILGDIVLGGDKKVSGHCCKNRIFGWGNSQIDFFVEWKIIVSSESRVFISQGCRSYFIHLGKPWEFTSL